MIVNKGFKYKIKPTENQLKNILQQGGNSRFLWNKLLEINMNKYKEEGKFNFSYSMVMDIPRLKEEFPFLKESFSQSLQTVGRQLNTALCNFLKERKTNKNIGFPVFKSKSKENDSFHCPQKWGLYKNCVQIPKIGKVQWIKHRPLQGKPKSITISQDGNDWYCSVLCEVNIKDKELKKDNIVGIDVGLKDFAILSDGTSINRERVIKKYEDKLAREQRKLSRKAKGSKNRDKQRRVVREVHKKIKNERLDFLHQTANRMIIKYDGFCVEDLAVKNMMRNHKLSKNIADVSWGEFYRQLEYKSLWNFKHYIEIGRFYPSTKKCSKCGFIKDSISLDERVFICNDCGFEISRDLNASINIKDIGIENTFGQKGINASGDDKVHAQKSRWSSMKEEKELHIN